MQDYREKNREKLRAYNYFYMKRKRAEHGWRYGQPTKARDMAERQGIKKVNQIEIKELERQLNEVLEKARKERAEIKKVRIIKMKELRDKEMTYKLIGKEFELNGSYVREVLSDNYSAQELFVDRKVYRTCFGCKIVFWGSPTKYCSKKCWQDHPKWTPEERRIKENVIRNKHNKDRYKNNPEYRKRCLAHSRKQYRNLTKK